MFLRIAVYSGRPGVPSGIESAIEGAEGNEVGADGDTGRAVSIFETGNSFGEAFPTVGRAVRGRRDREETLFTSGKRLHRRRVR